MTFQGMCKNSQGRCKTNLGEEPPNTATQYNSHWLHLTTCTAYALSSPRFEISSGTFQQNSAIIARYINHITCRVCIIYSFQYLIKTTIYSVNIGLPSPCDDMTTIFIKLFTFKLYILLYAKIWTGTF
jgi:hypothetical protein